MGPVAPPPPAGPVVLRVKLRYPDVPTFIDKFAVNIGRAGMFLPTRALQALGTELRFELRLADEQVVLSGLGRVAAVVAPDERGPDTIPGLAIEFQRMTRESRDLVMRLLEYRRERGLGEPALPSVEASVADSVADSLGEAAARDSAKALPMRAALPTALPAEPPRRPRRPLAELIADLPPAERATVDLDGDDASLGLARARARARALAEREVDSELAELLRPHQPPPLDAAHAAAELARQLGLEPPPVRRSDPRAGDEPWSAAVEGTTPKFELSRRSSSARGSQPPQLSTQAVPAAPASPPRVAAAVPPQETAARAEAAPVTDAAVDDKDRVGEPDGSDVSRRPRVARPQRLTRPASVFARRTSPTQPPPEPSTPAPSTAHMGPAPEAREPTSGFERVLAELEESEPPRSTSAPGLEEDPLDQLAIEALVDAAPQRGEPVAAPRAGVEALDLGALGESAFEILLEEDLSDGEPGEASASEPPPEAQSSVPTWRRTAGFDPLDPPFDTTRSADFTPPTIPGRIPTQELDLESALEALDLGADDLPLRPATRTANATSTPPGASASRASRSATAELDDLAIELELDDPG